MLILLKLCYLSRMNHTEHEKAAAEMVSQVALAYASIYAKPGDLQASHIAVITAAIDILVRAFELATDDLSPERRKDLLTGENE